MSTTHSTLAMDACRLMRMYGSAVATMLASSWPMNAPTQTVATASQGAEWSARMRAGRGGSVSIRLRRGASGSDTNVGASLHALVGGRRHHHIIQHGRAADRVRSLMSPPGDGTMVTEIGSIRRSILR